jgi:AcrR family transcriptional regulator
MADRSNSQVLATVASRCVNGPMRKQAKAEKQPTVVTGRDAILDAAEQVFGTHGFDGGSMSQIAQLAGVAQSLLHYHYKSKDLLYEAVFERRATQIRGIRQARLDALFADSAKVRVEEVLEILFLSLETLLESKDVELRYYVQMIAEVTLSTNERSVEIVKRHYDPSAEMFVKAIRTIYPTLSKDSAVWCYLFAIGARMHAHASSARAIRLGADKKNGHRQYAMLVPFVAAGIKAIVRDR